MWGKVLPFDFFHLLGDFFFVFTLPQPQEPTHTTPSRTKSHILERKAQMEPKKPLYLSQVLSLPKKDNEMNRKRSGKKKKMIRGKVLP